MIILKYTVDIKSLLNKTDAGRSIGFVPTMGALHKGHISLLKRSRESCDVAVSSIFVNPTQFNNADDFKKYPITLEEDIYLLEKNGCDILFIPGVNEVYPDGEGNKEHFDLGYLENILEGKFRPGHFQGVCQVVSRLLNIVNPTHLFLGQKDYQQCMVIKRLVQLLRLNTELIICPTLRESSGLAMSSRNLRFTEEQKVNAAEIYKVLLDVKNNIKTGSIDHLKKEAEEYLIQKNFKPDYIEITEADNLKTIHEWDGNTNLVILAAAFLGDVRLIDNILLNE